MVEVSGAPTARGHARTMPSPRGRAGVSGWLRLSQASSGRCLPGLWLRRSFCVRLIAAVRTVNLRHSAGCDKRNPMRQQGDDGPRGWAPRHENRD